MTGEFERAAGYLLFRERGGKREYLLVRNKNGRHWGFPKGRIEAGETPQEAARREVSEEVGIRDLRPVPGFSRTINYSFIRNGKLIHKEVTYFLAETQEEGVLNAEELVDMRWLPFARALATLTFPEQQGVLKEAEEALAHQKNETLGRS